MAQLTVDDPPTNLCLDFSRGDTVDLDMKEIGHRRITSRDFSDSQFPPSFSCVSDFLSSNDASTCRSTNLIPSLEHSSLM